MTSQLPGLSNENSATLPKTNSAPLASSRNTRSEPVADGGRAPAGKPMAGPADGGAAGTSDALRKTRCVAASPENWKVCLSSNSVFSAFARFTSTTFGFGRGSADGTPGFGGAGLTVNANHLESNENSSDPKPPPPGNFVSLPSAIERRITSPSPSTGATRWANHLPSADRAVPRMERQELASASVSGFLPAGCGDVLRSSSSFF